MEINQCIDYVKSLGASVLLTDVVKCNGSIFSKKEKNIVISNYGIHLFKGNSAKPEEEITWFAIKSYDCKDKTVKISYNNNQIQFKIEEKSKIPKAIEDTLQKLITPTELFEINPKLVSKPTPNSAFYRILKLQNNISRDLNVVIRYQQNKIVLDNTNAEKILEIIPLLPSIHSLEIILHPDGGNYKELTHFLAKDSQIHHLHFNGPLTLSFFNEVVSTLTANEQTHVRALSFSNSNFSESLFYSLISLVNAKTIRSLSFHNAFSTNIYHFYNKFLPSIRKGLRTLNLKDSSGITLQSIFTSRTVVLSLEGCGIELNSIFDVLSANSTTLKNLRSINISHNLCTKSFAKKRYQFPEYLSTIYASGIEWRGYNLTSFFDIIFSYFPRGLNLTFSHTNATQADWSSLNEFLSVTKFRNLISLDWSGNPMSLQLLSFLGRNKYLSMLNVSECFSEQRPNEISVFNNYIEGTQHLKILILRGSTITRIGSELSSVLNSFAKNQSLIFIDISNNHGGNKCIPFLKKYTEVNHTKMQYIYFDGIYPENFSDYKLFLDYLVKQNDIKSCFMFPINDLKQFIGPDLTYGQYVEYMDGFARLLSNAQNQSDFISNERNNKDEFTNIWTKPFILVPNKQPTFEFPEYTTDDMIMHIMNQKLLPIQPPESPTVDRNLTITGKETLTAAANALASSPKRHNRRPKSPEVIEAGNEDSSKKQYYSNERASNTITPPTSPKRSVEKRIETSQEVENANTGSIKRKHRSHSARKMHTIDGHLDFVTPISATHEKDTDDDGITRRKNHKHRTPFTLNGDEDIKTDFLAQPKTEQKRRRHKSTQRVSQTLQGDEIPRRHKKKSHKHGSGQTLDDNNNNNINNSPISSIFEDPELMKLQKRHQKPSPLAPTQQQSSQNRSEADKKSVEKGAVREHRKRRSQSEKKHAPSPFSITEPVSLDIIPQGNETRTPQPFINHRRRKHDKLLQITPTTQSLDKPAISSAAPSQNGDAVNNKEKKEELVEQQVHRHHRKKKNTIEEKAETTPFILSSPRVGLAEQKILNPSEELQTLPYAKERHRKYRTLQGDSPERSDNAEENTEKQETRKKRRKRTSSPQTLDPEISIRKHRKHKVDENKEERFAQITETKTANESAEKKKRRKKHHTLDGETNEIINTKEQNNNRVHSSHKTRDIKELVVKEDLLKKSADEDKKEEEQNNEQQKEEEIIEEKQVDEKSKQENEQNIEIKSSKEKEESNNNEEIQKETSKEESVNQEDNSQQKKTKQTKVRIQQFIDTKNTAGMSKEEIAKQREIERKRRKEKERQRMFLPVSSEDEPLFVQPIPEYPKEDSKLSHNRDEASPKEKKNSSFISESEPLFIFENSNSNREQSEAAQSPQPSAEAKQEKPRREENDIGEDSDKWDLPPLPAYPIPGDIWDNLDRQFVTENMIKELKKMPIDMHFHHKPGTIFNTSSSEVFQIDPNNTNDNSTIDNSPNDQNN